MRRTLFLLMVAFFAEVPVFSPAGAAELVLVENSVSRAPIIVFKDAPRYTRQAADELAEYLEKTSGARPAVIEGLPEPLPERAIWVGCQPVLKELFPGLDLDFRYPEEILIAANENHLVIAGRDRWDPDNMTMTSSIGRPVTGIQPEYGTVNAVYTFLHDHLGIRWLWPGELGEDIIPRRTVAFAPFEYRFHPPFRKRHIWPQQPPEWHRRQRNLHYSMPLQGTGHAYEDWWEKYHEAHPERFALRPDGTRTPERWGAEPNPHAVKLCVSNPEVAEQWLKNAEEETSDNPQLTILSASPNDGGGFCVCDNCRAWDHSDAPPGVLTDRYVKFWNTLARGLKDRFPDRDLHLGVMAYSAYSRPPLGETLEDNIAVFHVGHFPATTEEARRAQKEQWLAWAAMADRMVYRPNLWYWGGGIWGFPEVSLNRMIEDFRFLAENNCTGIVVDTMRGNWANLGPENYLLARLAYDPLQDGQALLADYYRRAYGPAAAEMEAYWALMEQTRDAVFADPGFKLGAGNRFNLVQVLARVYDEEFLARAGAFLDRAAEAAAGSEPYRRRVAFTRAGLEHVRLMLSAVPVMARVRAGLGLDPAETRESAVWQAMGRAREFAGDPADIRRAQAIWAEIERNIAEAGPFALWGNVGLIMRNRNQYMGGMHPFFGPPAEELVAAAEAAEAAARE